MTHRKTPEFYDIAQVKDSQIRFAVVVTHCHGKWVFSRHHDRTTWEIPGGHREPGETPLETARRELYEETGAIDGEIYPVRLYKMRDFGLLCFAEVRELGPLPKDTEIAEARLFDTLPENLTYDGIHDRLFQHIQEWLNAACLDAEA